MTVRQVKGGVVAPRETREARAPAEAGGTHTVTPGDTLWKLAQEAYGDPNKWPLIRDANPGKVTMRGDTALITPGTKLTIPSAQTQAPSRPQGWAPTGGQGLRVPTGPSEGLKPSSKPEGLQLPTDVRLGGKPQLPGDGLTGLPTDARIGGKPQLPGDGLTGLPTDARLGGKPQLPDFKPAGSAFGAFVALKPQLGDLQRSLSLPPGIRERVMTALERGERPAPPFDATLDLVNQVKAQLQGQLEALPPDQQQTLRKVVDDELSHLPLARQALLGRPSSGVVELPPGALEGPSFEELSRPAGAAPSSSGAAPASTGTSAARLAEVLEQTRDDGVLQVPEFGSLLRALGEDMLAARSPADAEAVWKGAWESLSGLLQDTTVPSGQRELMQSAVQGLQQVAQQGDPRQLIEFGRRLEQLEVPPEQVPLTPRTYGAVTSALADQVVRPHEFGPVLRAVVADLKANPSAAAFAETVGAFDFLSGQVTAGPHRDAFKKLYTDFTSHVLSGPNEATLLRFAAEFEKLT